MDRDISKVLYTPGQIQDRVCQLGEQISREYAGKDLVLVGILKGSIVFFADLMRTIGLPMTIDFMAISSYGSAAKSTGVVRFIKDLDHEIIGKDVIVVEDIIDTGLTLAFLKENLATRGARDIKVCALLDKPDRRKVQMSADYVGFAIPDEFVVGYGLDFDQRYRNLPYIGVLRPEVYARAKEA